MDRAKEKTIAAYLREYALYCAGIPVTEDILVPIPFVINFPEECLVSIRHNPCFCSLWESILTILRRCEQEAYARRADNDNDCYCQGDIGKVKPEVAELFLRHVYTHEQQMLESFVESINRYETESLEMQLLNVGEKRREELLNIIAEYKADNTPSRMLNLFLVVYGIGFDCSGFASYALSHVMQRLGMTTREQEMTLGLESGFTKPSAIRLIREYHEELGLAEENGGSRELFRYMTSDDMGPELACYGKILPGDIINKYKPGHDVMSHILIIIDVERDEQGTPIRIHAADCTSMKLRKGSDLQTYAIPPNNIVDYREGEEEMQMDPVLEYVYRRPVSLWIT